MLAAYNGNVDVVTVLLEAGASIEAKDNVSKRNIYMHMCVCVCVCVCVCYILES